MANGGEDNGRFRTATLVNWHLLPEVELTPGGFAKMQAAPWPEGIDTMVRFKDALSCDIREAQGLHFYSDDYQFERIWTKPEVYLELLEQFAFRGRAGLLHVPGFPGATPEMEPPPQPAAGGLVAGTRAERDPQCQLGRQSKLCLDL